MLAKSIFISHRRNKGQASTEAILVKNLLTKMTVCRVFMDVTEDYLGPFPTTLKEKIRNSDVFILVLPKADNYDYLCDTENWVHKEIRYALTFKETLNKPSRIIPLVFDRDFKFPSKERLGDIADIADYSFVFYDTNNTDSASKLIRSTGAITRKVRNFLLILLFAVSAIIGFAMLNWLNDSKTDVVSEYKYEASKEFVYNTNRFDSFTLFTDSCSPYVNDYLTWYLAEFVKGADPAMNAEFNKVYVKEYSIKLIVLSYLAFTYGDLDKSVDKTLVSELMDECYENIPNEARYPITLKQLSNDDRKAKFELIINKTIETLNSDPRLKSIDENMSEALKLRLMGKLWPY